MNISMKNGRIEIDGREFTVRNNVSINGKKVIVDGVVQSGELVGEIHVVVHGDVDSINMGSGDVTALNVGGIRTGSGDVKCADVYGSINTGSGDVICGSVSGSVSTMSGDISQRLF